MCVRVFYVFKEHSFSVFQLGSKQLCIENCKCCFVESGCCKNLSC